MVALIPTVILIGVAYMFFIQSVAAYTQDIQNEGVKTSIWSLLQVGGYLIVFWSCVIMGLILQKMKLFKEEKKVVS